MQVIQWALYCTAHGAVMQQPILTCLGVMEAAKTSASTHVLGSTCTVRTSGGPEDCTTVITEID